jgi:peptidoglycan/xylan/chitin deacetylase (PgdA/CDA1 family)
VSGLPASIGSALLRARRRPPFILCYHGVGTPADGADPHGLFVSREQFAQHLDTILAEGYTLLTVSDLWSRIAAGETVSGLGAVSFDDAFEQTDREAMPELAARGLPSTVYVATGLLGGPHPHMPGERIMTAQEVRELAATGVEIGAHSVDHAHLSQLGEAAALGQLRSSREVLEELLGQPVRSMAYPFGDYDAETVRSARAAGYETACACAGAGPWEALALPREPVFPSVTTLRLQIKLAGLYGHVHRVAELRGRLRRR